MALKNKYVVFAVLGLAVVSVAAWWFQSPARSSRAGTPAPQGNAAAKPGAQGPAKPVVVEATKVRQMTMRDDAETVGMVDRPRLSLAADGDEAAFVQTPLALFLTTAHSLLSSPW